MQLIFCTLLVLYTTSALAAASGIPELELSETDLDDYEWTDAPLDEWLADRRVLSEQLDREPFHYPVTQGGTWCKVPFRAQFQSDTF